MKALKFEAGSSGAFDRHMELQASNLIQAAAHGKNTKTLGVLAERLGIARNRLSRLCDALGIRDSVNRILRS
jgi:hypothetical protein